MEFTLSLIKMLRCTVLPCFILLKTPYLNGYTQTLFTTVNPFKSQEDFMLFKYLFISVCVFLCLEMDL